MQTIRIQIKSKIALRLLKDLEMASIIKILDREKNDTQSKLSAQLRGAISEERVHELTQQQEKNRDEWDNRTI